MTTTHSPPVKPTVLSLSFTNESYERLSNRMRRNWRGDPKLSSDVTSIVIRVWSVTGTDVLAYTGRTALSRTSPDHILSTLPLTPMDNILVVVKRALVAVR